MRLLQKSNVGLVSFYLRLPNLHKQIRRYLQCKDNICNYIKDIMISSESLWEVGFSQATLCHYSFRTLASLPQIYLSTWQIELSCLQGCLMIFSTAIIQLFSDSRWESFRRLRKYLVTDCIDRARLENTILVLYLNSTITMWKWSKEHGRLCSDTKGSILTVRQSRWEDARDDCCSRASHNLFKLLQNHF